MNISYSGSRKLGREQNKDALQNVTTSLGSCENYKIDDCKIFSLFSELYVARVYNETYSHWSSTPISSVLYVLFESHFGVPTFPGCSVRKAKHYYRQMNDRRAIFQRAIEHKPRLFINHFKRLFPRSFP